MDDLTNQTTMNIKEIRRSLSWRHNPASVFILVVPLVTIAITGHVIAAILMWKRDGHPLGMAIVVTLYGAGAWVILKLHKLFRRP